MGFKEVQTLDADTTITIGGFVKKTGKKNPTGAEGFYLGKREVTGGKFTRPGKKDRIYFLQTEDGNLGVWGKTDLDRKMDNVVPGTMIRISYVGMTPTPNGDMHKYKVEVDTSNTIEVPNYATSETAINEPSGNEKAEARYGKNYSVDNEDEDSDYDGTETLDEDTEDDEEVDEAPRVTTRNVAALSGTAADRAKRAQELLSKAKNK